MPTNLVGGYLNGPHNYLMAGYLAESAYHNFGFQVRQQAAVQIGMQVEEAIYNTTQLRILCDFASRGTAALAGLNWTATPATAAADFQPKNLNTDILEQRYQSNSGITTVTLDCDTGVSQGVYVDTFAILEHNLTAGATIEVKGSDLANFATVNDTFAMVGGDGNSYLIASALPLRPSRYWRFSIQDTANPDGLLKIGAIVFGRSKLFTTTENFADPLEFSYRHFKDSNPTEGFTSVSNDRALRKALTLRFEKLRKDLGNYEILEDMIKTERTSIKCLIIPTPDDPGAFAVFAKLVELPTITHVKHSEGIDESGHYIDLELRWDESL